MWTWALEENAGAATRTATKLWNDPGYNNAKEWISVGEGVSLPRLIRLSRSPIRLRNVEPLSLGQLLESADSVQFALC